MGILTVESHRVEGGGEPFRRHPRCDVVEAGVGLLRRALPGEHPGGVLLGAAEGIDPGGVGELAGEVLLEEPLETVPPGAKTRSGHPGNPGVRQGLVMEGDGDLPPPDVVDELVTGELGDHRVPTLQCLEVLRVELGAGLGCRLGEVDIGLHRRSHQAIETVGGLRLLPGPLVVPVDLLDDLGEVTNPVRGDDMLLDRLVHGQVEAARRLEAVIGEDADQCLVEAVGPRVVEVRSHREMNGELLVVGVEGEGVPLELLAHVTQRIQRSLLVGLVDRHQIGEIEHVDLLELGGCPVLGSHHIDGEVGVVDDLGVRLADPRGLQKDQVVSGGLDDVQSVLHIGGEGEIGLPGGEGPHIGAGMGK